MGIVSLVPVSDEIRSYSSLNSVDYADAFQMAVPSADHRSAEEWLREIFESLPVPARMGLRLAWRAISVRLGPFPSTEYVLGWEIEDSETSSARLGTAGWIGVRANLVLRTDAAVLTFATLLEYRRPAGRVMWFSVRPIHLRIVRFLLSRTAVRA
ncbi:DUF2867 domain-containing protein [Saccharopolyspora sp. K220]|uniref:DUF2867 domain-containing protein n=1 Tax=Saccharopolyspora soli TaxID=2926618 RepID=UPI001F593EEB|nr:DUF2867 domain-containing protein [Saccharopolyspora soli]MCI2419521.1 DUF2867 domain-containing protein [Saccharopolyspora soli]